MPRRNFEVFEDLKKDTTILLIDADPRALQLNACALKAEGYRPVIPRIDGSGFLFPDNEAPELILLDLELARALGSMDVATLARKTYPEARIVLLSSSFTIPGEAEHMDGFMQKRAPDVLARAVGFWLQHFAKKKGSKSKGAVSSGAST